MSRCVHIATAIVSTIYLSVGLIGALAYPDTKTGDILLNFLDERFFSALMLGLVAAITMLYPIINFPAVAAIDSLCAGATGAPSIKRRRIASVVMVAVVVVVDQGIEDLNLLFGF